MLHSGEFGLLSLLIHGMIIGHLSGVGQSMPNTYEEYRGLQNGEQQSEKDYDVYRGSSVRSPYRLINKAGSVAEKRPGQPSRPASPVGSRSEQLDFVSDVQLAEVYSNQNTTVQRVKKTKKRLRSKVKETYDGQPKSKTATGTEGGEPEEPTATDDADIKHLSSPTVPIRLVSSNGRLVMKMNATIVATASLESVLEL